MKHLDLLGLSLVTDDVALVVHHNAFAANIDLVSLAEVFCPLVRMLQTVLLCGLLFLLLLVLFLCLSHVLLTVEVV